MRSAGLLLLRAVAACALLAPRDARAATELVAHVAPSLPREVVAVAAQDDGTTLVLGRGGRVAHLRPDGTIASHAFADVGDGETLASGGGTAWVATTRGALRCQRRGGDVLDVPLRGAGAAELVALEDGRAATMRGRRLVVVTCDGTEPVTLVTLAESLEVRRLALGAGAAGAASLLVLGRTEGSASSVPEDVLALVRADATGLRVLGRGPRLCELVSGAAVSCVSIPIVDTRWTRASIDARELAVLPDGAGGTWVVAARDHPRGIRLGADGALGATPGEIDEAAVHDTADVRIPAVAWDPVVGRAAFVTPGRDDPYTSVVRWVSASGEVRRERVPTARGASRLSHGRTVVAASRSHLAIARSGTLFTRTREGVWAAFAGPEAVREDGEAREAESATHGEQLLVGGLFLGGLAAQVGLTAAIHRQSFGTVAAVSGATFAAAGLAALPFHVVDLLARPFAKGPPPWFPLELTVVSLAAAGAYAGSGAAAELTPRPTFLGALGGAAITSVVLGGFSMLTKKRISLPLVASALCAGAAGGEFAFR